MEKIFYFKKMSIIPKLNKTKKKSPKLIFKPNLANKNTEKDLKLFEKKTKSVQHVKIEFKAEPVKKNSKNKKESSNEIYASHKTFDRDTEKEESEHFGEIDGDYFVLKISNELDLDNLRIDFKNKTVYDMKSSNIYGIETKNVDLFLCKNFVKEIPVENSDKEPEKEYEIKGVGFINSINYLN